MRNLKRNRAQCDEEVCSELLAYEPPFPWKTLLGFLESRAVEGIESVQYDDTGEGTYLRAVHLPYEGGCCSGWIMVQNAAECDALLLTFSGPLLPVLSQVKDRVRQVFDLDCVPDVIHRHLASMDEIKEGMNVRGARVPGSFDSFEMATRAILGQQVTVKAARTLANCLVAAHGREVDTSVGLSRVFPSPEAIAALPEPVADVLGPLGITGNRCKAIRALAEAIVEGEIVLSPGADAPRQMERLLALPGIGPWTVEYLAMRALDWPDAFPHTDYGVKLALKQAWGLEDYPPPKQILAVAEPWRPWRSYATLNLWGSLT